MKLTNISLCLIILSASSSLAFGEANTSEFGAAISAPPTKTTRPAIPSDQNSPKSSIMRDPKARVLMRIDNMSARLEKIMERAKKANLPEDKLATITAKRSELFARLMELKNKVPATEESALRLELKDLHGKMQELRAELGQANAKKQSELRKPSSLFNGASEGSRPAQ